MSGFEITGIVLGALPLVVSLLTEYRQSLEVVRLLTERRHRREIQRYETDLSTQSILFRNSLEQVLLRVVHDDDLIARLLQSPGGDLWRNGRLNKDFQSMLGGSYAAYLLCITNLQDLLKTFSDRIGIESTSSGRMQALKRIKFVLSKTYYEELQDKIRHANSSLTTLVAQVFAMADIRTTRRMKNKAARDYRKIRQHAKSIYDVLVCGESWRCSCKASHKLLLQLAPKRSDEDATEPPDARSPKAKFNIHVFLQPTQEANAIQNGGQEVRIEAAELRDRQRHPNYSNINVLDNQQLMNTQTAKKGVQFSLAASTLQALPWSSDLDTSAAIDDLCRSLKNGKATMGDFHVGYLVDHRSSRRHDVYTIGVLNDGRPARSVQDILSDPSLRTRCGPVEFPALSYRNQRFLAATLATSLIRFHGNWLTPRWGLNDILLPAELDFFNTNIDFCLLSRGLADQITLQQQDKIALSPLISSAVLFPLGLALIELSLGEPLRALRTPEDSDPDEAVADLKTATRVMKLVKHKSGPEYCSIVNTCLRWDGPDGEVLDNDVLQLQILERVVMPLLEDFEVVEESTRCR